MIRPSETRHNESGNVIFYIFIAIGLLAALSFAVSQGMRGGGKSLTEDRSHLAASEVIAYGDTLAKAAGQMRLRNIPLGSFSFAHPNANPAYGTYNNNPAAEIFNPQGGGVIYRAPPALALTNPISLYFFTGENAVEGVGRDCGSEDCNELLMLVSFIKPEVCQMINDILGYAAKTDPLPTDSDTGLSVPFDGTYSYNTIISDEASILRGRTAGCYTDSGSGDNVYYQVLIAR